MKGPQPGKLDIPRASSVYPDDVSPPDSPRTGDGARSSSPNVSPITDGSSGYRVHAAHSRTYASNIPLPQSESSGGASGVVSGWKEKIAAAKSLTKDSQIMWDDYSGEPTSSEKGKSGQVVPGSTKFDPSPSPTASRIPEPKQSMFGIQLKKALPKEAPKPSWQPMEPWRGRGDKQPIKPAMDDKPRPPGKALPTPSERRQKGGLRQMMNMRVNGNGRTTPTPATHAASSPASHGRRSSNKDAAKENISPRSASDAADPTPSRQPATADHPPRTDSARYNSPTPTQRYSPVPEPATARPIYASPVTMDRSKELPPPPPSELTPPSTARSDPADAASKPATPTDDLRTAVHSLTLDHEPPSMSRFSWTTYATTVPDDTAASTPTRQSLDENRPPVPPLPATPPPAAVPAPLQPRSQSSTPSAPSILDRKRPVPTARAAFAPKPPSRKPTPSDLSLLAAGASPHHHLAADHSGASTPTGGGGGGHKTLPARPAAEAAVDRVTLLEAKLASLHRRKGNLATVIAELDTVAHPSSAAGDFESRREVARTVESLAAESAAIAKEIHETGLTLHRVLRRRDDRAEPTGLWVRRVTE